MKRILLSSPFMSEEGYELSFIQEAFDKNWIAPLGENVDKFEEEFASYMGGGHSVALSSGTAALHLGLKALGVGRKYKPGLGRLQEKEDEIVICSSYTFAASANPIVYLGATPVFVDSDESWGMDPELLKEALEEYGDQVKAVVLVHLYGPVAKMDQIHSLCDDYDVPLYEDATEALGSKYTSYYYKKPGEEKRAWHDEAIIRKAGTAGDISAFSFNGNKLITTSGGGMALVNREDSKELADKMRFWATQSREPFPYYQHEELGYNYRMSNICAGIGRGQLKIIDRLIAKKKAIYDLYKSELEDGGYGSMMPSQDEDLLTPWLSCGVFNASPERIIDELDKVNAEARHLWKPLHMQPYFEHCPAFIREEGSFSKELFEKGVCLPSDVNMTKEEQMRVIDTIKKLIGEDI